jgi:hypothetical protein
MSKLVKDLNDIPKGVCRCSVCGETKDNIYFNWYKYRWTSRGGKYRLRVNTYCDVCQKSTSKELSKIKKTLLKDHPKPEYGDNCDLCGKPVYEHRKEVPEGVDGTWGFQCDHDHNTKKFRGWLCKPCNTGLGGIGDNLESIKRAERYLLEAEERNSN